LRARARDCTCAAYLRTSVPTCVHAQANFTRTVAQWLSAANRSAQLGDLLTAVAGAVDLGVFATNHAPQFIENASDKVRANAIGRALKTRLFVPLKRDYPFPWNAIIRTHNKRLSLPLNPRLSVPLNPRLSLPLNPRISGPIIRG
jgi:hypothetical protein